VIPFVTQAHNYVVVDGDTIKDQDSGYIRLLGIDTPEIKGQCQFEKDKALDAKTYLKALIEGSNDVKIIGHKSDKYGRLLAHVLVDGQNASSLMLNSGLARPYDGKKRKGWC
jgi:endonuclease YncB( thermonuclease family)